MRQHFHADRWLREVDAKDGSSTLFIADAGHWVMVDRPNEFNRAVEEFVKGE